MSTESLYIVESEEILLKVSYDSIIDGVVLPVLLCVL